MNAQEAWKRLLSQIDCSYYLTKQEFKAIEEAVVPSEPKKAPVKKKPASKK